MASAQYLITNNGTTVLALALSPSDTTLQVATGKGDLFPVVTAPDYTMLTLQDSNDNVEIVQVTARASGSDIMTIVRAQDGTTAQSWTGGDTVELRVTHALIAWILTQITAALKEPITAFCGGEPQVIFANDGDIVMSSSAVES
jgi:hypothetical protein